jgi:hypothetical protein
VPCSAAPQFASAVVTAGVASAVFQEGPDPTLQLDQRCQHGSGPLSDGPLSVQIVDHERVGMALWTVALPMVRVIGGKLRVSMVKDLGIMGWPDRSSEASANEAEDTERAKRHRKTGR